MTAKVILNPYAARWNARARWAEAEAALKAAGVDYEMVESSGAGIAQGWPPKQCGMDSRQLSLPVGMGRMARLSTV